MGKPGASIAALCLAVGALPWAAAASAPGPGGGDLDAVKKSGVLRHLGVPYARFVSGEGEGLDVEMMRAFAAHLGRALRVRGDQLDGRARRPHRTQGLGEGARPGPRGAPRSGVTSSPPGSR